MVLVLTFNHVAFLNEIKLALNTMCMYKFICSFQSNTLANISILNLIIYTCALCVFVCVNGE